MPNYFDLPPKQAIYLEPYPQIVLGLDLGTTHSGVGYAIIINDEVKVHGFVNLWPANPRNVFQPQLHRAKTKSALRFIGERDNQQVLWGYSATSDYWGEEKKGPIELFKLLLLEDYTPPDLATSDILQKARSLAAEAERTPTELVALFLKKILVHAGHHIEEVCALRRWHVGNAVTRFVVTLPSDWPDRARERLSQALLEANVNQREFPGHTTIFINEADAAARLVAKVLSAGTEYRDFLIPGNAFVVVDAGGATIDLVTYRVKQVSPQVVVEQCTSPTSILAGSVFVDIALTALIKEKVADKFGESSYFTLSPSELDAILNNEWREMTITGRYRALTVILPEKFGRSRSSSNLPMTIECDELLSIVTETSIGHTKKAISDQISNATSLPQVGAMVKMICFVGGYSNNMYFADQLKAEFESSSLRVVQPRGQTCWAATGLGAALHGIDDHYWRRGIKIPDIVVDRPQFQASFGFTLSSGIGGDDSKPIKWLAKKGDFYNPSLLPTSHTLDLDLAENNVTVQTEVYKSTSAELSAVGPSEMWSACRWVIPVFEDFPMIELEEMTLLPSIDHDMHYRCPVEITFSISPGDLFVAKAYRNGRELSRTVLRNDGN